jgi:hypothetical protein
VAGRKRWQEPISAVISGNTGLPDGKARYNLPPAEIQRLVADFMAEVSGR